MDGVTKQRTSPSGFQNSVRADKFQESVDPGRLPTDFNDDTVTADVDDLPSELFRQERNSGHMDVLLSKGL